MDKRVWNQERTALRYLLSKLCSVCMYEKIRRLALGVSRSDFRALLPVVTVLIRTSYDDYDEVQCGVLNHNILLSDKLVSACVSWQLVDV